MNVPERLFGNRTSRIAIALTFVTTSAMAASSALAQELEPRAYANLPVGMNFVLTGYSYSTGGILVDPSVRLEDARADVRTTFLGYLRALDVAGRSGQVKFLLPYASLSGSARVAGERRERRVSGVGDPILGFSVNLYGAPALSGRNFASYRQDLNLGVNFLVSPPLGQYDEERVINIGSNRWTFRVEAGLSKAFAQWILDAALSTSFFTDNNDFLVDRVREQEPIHAFQIHAIFNLPSRAWMALGGTYYEGGEVTSRQDGDVTHLIGQRNSRIGTTVSLPIDSKNSLRLQGSTSVAVRTGTSFDTFSITWQHRWSNE